MFKNLILEKVTKFVTLLAKLIKKERKHRLLILGMKEKRWLQILQTLEMRIREYYEQLQANVFENVD